MVVTLTWASISWIVLGIVWAAALLWPLPEEHGYFAGVGGVITTALHIGVAMVVTIVVLLLRVIFG